MNKASPRTPTPRHRAIRAQPEMSGRSCGQLPCVLIIAQPPRHQSNNDSLSTPATGTSIITQSRCGIPGPVPSLRAVPPVMAICLGAHCRTVLECAKLEEPRMRLTAKRRRTSRYLVAEPAGQQTAILFLDAQPDNHKPSRDIDILIALDISVPSPANSCTNIADQLTWRIDNRQDDKTLVAPNSETVPSMRSRARTESGGDSSNERELMPLQRFFRNGA